MILLKKVPFLAIDSKMDMIILAHRQKVISRSRMNTTHPKYEKDVYGWATHTAELLRKKKMSEVDFDNIIEEMEALGRSEKHELINRLALVITHLLKWQYQSEKRTRSWELTIKEQRRQVKIHFSDNPSLKAKLDEILENAYFIARLKAEKETSIDESSFPEECPYTFEEITSDVFYPDPR